MTYAAVLSVEHTQGALRYRLDVPELGGPLQEEFRHPLDQGTLQALLQSADGLLRSAESLAFPRDARERGSILYRTLVPVRLRAQLKALTGPLLVSTSLLGLPWELLHDDEEFWGLRYALGKRLVMNRPLPPPGAAPDHPRPRALVIGSDPRGDLPFVRAEVEAICDALDGFADVDCVTDRLATFDTVTSYLGQGFDLIHYCGHVVVSPDGSPALLLADEQGLSATTIEANVTGRPLVFLNGCASARGTLEESSGRWEATVANVAYGFLFGGALGVVGTLSDVSDRHAGVLAEEFYRRALEGEAIGEALRVARGRCRARPGSAASPTWLSFVLYGHPAQVLLPAAAPDTTRGAAALALAPPTVVPVAEPTPVATPAPAVPRRRAWWATAAALVVAVLVGLFAIRTPAPPPPVVVGVMEVQARGRGTPRWMADITRDGLNTILSKFPGGIHVYARQKIDLVRDKRHLGAIEAAEVLGVRKMLSAVVTADETQVSLELEVIDVGSGMLESAEHVEGPRDHFMELGTELALRAVRRLGVDPSQDQVRAILADRGNETLRAYQLLNDTLGDDAPADDPAPAPRAPGRGSWLHWSAVAWAQEPTPAEVAIRALLAEYASALQAKNLDRLATLQSDLNDTQRAKLESYFATAGGLQVHLSDIDVLVEGDDAVATFTREDVFTDAGTGRATRLEVRTSSTLAKREGTWKIVKSRRAS